MKNNPIKSSKRVFEILEVFEIEQRPLALKELVQILGYPHSSASALLKSLVVMGYLGYDRYSRTYMPTMRLASLGNWVQGALFGEEGDIHKLMVELSEAAGETVTLSTQSDLFVQYIYLIPSRLPIWYRIPIGMVRPIARSGIGWLMLGARSDEEIEQILRRINFHEPHPDRRIASVDLMRHVEQARADGYVFSKHTLEAGAGSIGMLLPERRFSRIFALGIHGPVERLEAKCDAVLRLLKEGIASLPG